MVVGGRGEKVMGVMLRLVVERLGVAMVRLGVVVVGEEVLVK